MRVCISIILTSVFLSLSAQKVGFNPEWMPPAVGDKKWKPIVGLDSRHSFYDDRSVKFLGLRIGAEHRGVHSFGFGFYRMNRGETYTDILIDRPDASADAEVRFQAGYAALFYERVFMQAGKLELAAPLYIGGGSVDGTYKDVTGVFRPYLNEPFSVIGFGVMAKYRILPWLEPGLGSGVRLIYNASPEVIQTLQRPYYMYKVSILLGEFYRHVIRRNGASH